MLKAVLQLCFGLIAVTACSNEPADVEFTAAVDGTPQRYVELLPPEFDDAESHDVLLAFHGHGSDRWQFIRDGRGECRAVRDVAARHGIILISPDYRAKTSWMGPAAEADVLQIIAEVKQRRRVKRVLLCGGSMGGTAVLTFTALHPVLVDGVCSLNGTANMVEYDQFQDAIAASYGGSKTDVPDQYRLRSAEFFPQQFTMPLSCTTGGRDTLVPPASVLRLLKAVEPTNEHVLSIHREEGGHSTTYEDASAALEFVITVKKQSLTAR